VLRPDASYPRYLVSGMTEVGKLATPVLLVLRYGAHGRVSQALWWTIKP